MRHSSLYLQDILSAAQSIPPEWGRDHPEVPWRDMAAMRDRLIHAYFGVDHGLVWRAIRERLPRILPHVKRMFTRYRPAGPDPSAPQ